MRPKLTIIVAGAKGSRIIGTESNDLPWPRIKGDLQHFRNITLGNPVIMGRVTFETLPQKNGSPFPLSNRTNIIITRNQEYVAPENVWIASSIEDAIQKSQILQSERICIIGGQQIYELALPFIDEIYYTEIDLSVNGTTCFPEIPDYFRLKTETVRSEETKDGGQVNYKIQHWVR